MKIHVVQAGESLSKIAQRYNVEVQKLKQINTHLSNPENIMQGMKIKIPTESKPVRMEKKQAVKPIQKEAPKPIQKEVQMPTQKEKPKVMHPYKDISPKMMPVVKEDDGGKPMEKKMMPIKKEQPKPISPVAEKKVEMPTMPTMPQEIQYIEESSSSDHYYFTQVQANMPEFNQPQVPYHYPVAYHHGPHHKHKPCGCGGHKMHHHMHKPKPCGCKGVPTYYMPVYPMQQPNPQEVYFQQQMQFMPAAQNVNPTSEFQYPKMEVDDESPSLNMPEMPDQNAGFHDPNSVMGDFQGQPFPQSQPNWYGAPNMNGQPGSWGAYNPGQQFAPPFQQGGMQGYGQQGAPFNPYAQFQQPFGEVPQAPTQNFQGQQPPYFRWEQDEE